MNNMWNRIIEKGTVCLGRFLNRGYSLWAPMKKPLIKSLVPLGAVLLFGSWVSQNHCLNKWTSESEHQQEFHNDMTIQMLFIDMWFIEYNRQVDREPQSPKLAAQAVMSLSKACLNTMKFVDAASGKATVSSVKQMTDRSRQLQRLLNEGKYQELIKQGMDIYAQYKERGYDPEIRHRWLTAVVRSRTWNDRFLWLYIIGSVFVGTGWTFRRYCHASDRVAAGESTGSTDG